MHKEFMIAALKQAWLGRGVCAPNPSVGAVAVHDNQIIASAWHQGAGKAHAEQSLLQQLPANLDNVTLYVTLEPCNHWGRTPPCVAEIINSKINRVVFGFRDPNPVVAANDTPQILKAAKISVEHFPLPEIDEFYQSYFFWTKTKRPWVTAKIAQTFDGKIAGPQGMRVSLSNKMCWEFTHQQRSYTDVILTTARTIRHDNPALNVRLHEVYTSKPIAIIDSQLALTADKQIFTTAKYCHIYHDECVAVKQPIPNCTYHAMPSRNGQLDLDAVISKLGELGYHDVWVEAGGALFSALHQQSLVQKTYVYLVPNLLGDEAISAYQGDNFFIYPHRVSWLAQKDNVIACLLWEKACLLD
ncbi:riboflavin biosynthesis protein [Legionella beliardensis]|uniref:Riboflavin biosynthesis protein RibD n=1 Tax=Legionella beliardensis TaxID=91822 RepID=A0A378I1L7_9GAMM|nr:bifunctional diaminohydroxyphosphoribosylaminopyrimidine deaminase/5-amino-6-(5-phosphoribosylamino)uracil reductase RibD [Legionella beliardensis]STX28610.1 riboflavin biosynthesis protein [Legionella beliardensis]